MAIDKYTPDIKVLPQPAQTTIAKNFKAKVNTIKIDKELGIISEYDVVLTDGTEITFDRSGNWKDIENSPNRAVPGALVLEAIGSDSSGPLLFSGPMALGYFLAAPVSRAQITFDSATIPNF